MFSRFSSTITMATTRELKAAVRTAIGKKLTSLSVEERKRQSDIVKEKLINLPAFKNANHISTFLSLDVEINTEPILRKIFEDGKKCFVPRYNKAGMEMVELHSMEDYATLPVTKWNIKQPAFKDVRRNALEAGIDLIIVPGVGFTATGSRLGHGGGYYDKYLRNICEKQTKPPLLVALAFKEQVLDDIPTESTDYKIDLVLYAD